MPELERYDPALGGRIKYEHFHRYAFACEQVEGLEVLDIASGEGYGSAMLAATAAKVSGVDVDPQAVSTANLRYGQKDRLTFHVGRAQEIPFPDDSFDAVTSFETIEHIEDPEALIREIRRVLKPKGFAIISTPNKSVYNAGLSQPNAFHLREMEMAEFVLMLEAAFNTVSVYGQRMVIASAISPVGRQEGTRNTADYRGYTVTETEDGAPLATPAITRLPPPEYVVCIVGDGVLPHPAGPDSMFLMREHDLWNEHAKVMRWASGLHEEDEAHAVGQVRDLDAVRAQITSLTDLSNAYEQEIARLNAEARSGADLSAIGPLLEEISGGPIAPDLPTLIRLLNRISVERATQDVRLTEYQELKASIKSTAAEIDEARRKLLDAQDLTRQQADEIGKMGRRYSEMQAQWERELARRGEAEAALALHRERSIAELAAAHGTLAEATLRAERLDQELAAARTELAAAGLKTELVVAERASLEEAWRESEERLKEASEALRAGDQTREALSTALAMVESRDRDVADLEHRLKDAVAACDAKTEARVALRADRTNAPPVRLLQDAHFSESLRARRGQAALASVKALRSTEEALGAVGALRSALKQQLQRGHAALASLPAPKRPHSHHPKSIKGRTLALFKGRGVPGEAARHPAIAQDAPFQILFDAGHYVRANGLSLALGQSALDHYFLEGRRQGLATHPLIDLQWLKRAWPANLAAPFDLVAYLTDPVFFQFSPHPLFDVEHYFRNNPDVLQAGVNPLAHYLLHGWREGRGANVLFDPGWYLANNADVLQSGMDPLTHYAQYGGAEGRQPHPLFDRAYYLQSNPDVAASGMEAYTHYIAYGYAEGRKPGPLSEDVERYLPMFRSDGAIDLLLGDEPTDRLRSSAAFWPPAWDGRYWLPQKLRDMILDRYGPDHLDLYTYLFSVIDRFADDPGAFGDSEECARLIDRAKSLAASAGDFRPTVSIIVPVYNNLLYTLTCIVSVLEIDHRYSFEIIVADDQSTDGTQVAIEAIGGIVRLNRNPVNLGFLLNCNAAAAVALGDYLVMLNNDVVVLPGWLDNLIAPMTQSHDIGFVGSKLINGDGTLQEAGGIFWQDGSAWNYGRNSDASLPEFNYLKDTDYVSGASIAIPREVWDEMDGFDPLFTPAYCEDSDVAFRIRAAGYRTVYHPHSVLVHHEGRSHGRDTGSGIKAYQVINQKKFLERWGPTLKRDHFPNGQETFEARDRSRNKPHILIVDHYVPQWDRDAGSRTVFQYIRMFLDRGFAVTFWPDNLHEDREYAAPLQAMGVEVIYHPAYVGRFPAWIAENGRYFDYALLCRPHITEKYIDDIKDQRNIKVIYYGVDLHCKRLEASFELTGDKASLVEAARWEAIERRICGKCDVVLYPGFHEVDVVRSWVPDSVAVLNFPITIFSDAELEDGRDNLDRIDDHDPFSLMFVGGFTHHPNVGAVKWFVEEVLPRLRRADARFHIRIAGSNAPPEISRLAGEGVTMLGRVSDDELMQMYRTAGFAVVPLLYGAGVKGKVVEAMARGVPVAMTSIGAQGIEEAGTLAIVEDDAGRMADALIAAANDRAESVRKGRAAIEFIRRWYSERAVEALLLPQIPQLATRG